MAGSNKALTIAVPIYNIELYLERCLRSLVADEALLSDLEVLLVDDGSTDGCPKICKEYTEKYPEVFTYIRKDNANYGSAVNTAIEAATARYFRIVDGDDCVATEGLSSLIRVLCATNEADMVISDYLTEYEASGVKSVKKFDVPRHRVLAFDEYPYGMASMHSKTFRTAILKHMPWRLDEGVSYTDVEFILFPMPFVSTYYYLPQVVYIYHVGREGQSMDPSSFGKQMNAHRLVLDRLLAWSDNLSQYGCSDQVIDYCEHRIGGMVADHVRRCLLASSDGSSFKDELLSLEDAIKCRPRISRCIRSKQLPFLRMSHYRSFTALSKLTQLKHAFLRNRAKNAT